MITEPKERERIESIAADLRNKGYEVVLDPSADELPSFLVPFHPDLVATSERDNLVVDVASARNFDADLVQRLAEVIDARPDWRFEVAFVNPTVAPDVPVVEDLAAEDDVDRFIANAELLARQGQIEAAVMLAWSAVEAILRRRARSAAPEIERQSSARVLNHLYSLGRLQPDVFERFTQLMRFRNAVAHGFSPAEHAPSLPELLVDIRRLQHAA